MKRQNLNIKETTGKGMNNLKFLLVLPILFIFIFSLINQDVNASQFSNSKMLMIQARNSSGAIQQNLPFVLSFNISSQNNCNAGNIIYSNVSQSLNSDINGFIQYNLTGININPDQAQIFLCYNRYNPSGTLLASEFTEITPSFQSKITNNITYNTITKEHLQFKSVNSSAIINISCFQIKDGTDTDYCVDATGIGTSFNTTYDAIAGNANTCPTNQIINGFYINGSPKCIADQTSAGSGFNPLNLAYLNNTQQWTVDQNFTNIRPHINNTYDLGAVNNTWANAYINRLYVNIFNFLIPYSTLTLTNSIVNADIYSIAGIVYSKLNLANSILGSDIQANVINQSHILDNSINGNKIQNNAINASQANIPICTGTDKLTRASGGSYLTCATDNTGSGVLQDVNNGSVVAITSNDKSLNISVIDPSYNITIDASLNLTNQGLLTNVSHLFQRTSNINDTINQNVVLANDTTLRDIALQFSQNNGSLVHKDSKGNITDGNLSCSNILGATSNLCTLVDTTGSGDNLINVAFINNSNRFTGLNNFSGDIIINNRTFLSYWTNNQSNYSSGELTNAYGGFWKNLTIDLTNSYSAFWKNLTIDLTNAYSTWWRNQSADAITWTQAQGYSTSGGDNLINVAFVNNSNGFTNQNNFTFNSGASLTASNWSNISIFISQVKDYPNESDSFIRKNNETIYNYTLGILTCPTGQVLTKLAPSTGLTCIAGSADGQGGLSNAISNLTGLTSSDGRINFSGSNDPRNNVSITLRLNDNVPFNITFLNYDIFNYNMSLASFNQYGQFWRNNTLDLLGLTSTWTAIQTFNLHTYITNLSITNNFAVFGNTTIQNLTITDLKTCTLKTNSNGGLYCGTDNTGSSQLDDIFNGTVKSITGTGIINVSTTDPTQNTTFTLLVTNESINQIQGNSSTYKKLAELNESGSHAPKQFGYNFTGTIVSLIGQNNTASNNFTIAKCFFLGAKESCDNGTAIVDRINGNPTSITYHN